MPIEGRRPETWAQRGAGGAARVIRCGVLPSPRFVAPRRGRRRSRRRDTSARNQLPETKEPPRRVPYTDGNGASAGDSAATTRLTTVDRSLRFMSRIASVGGTRRAEGSPLGAVPWLSSFPPTSWPPGKTLTNPAVVRGQLGRHRQDARVVPDRDAVGHEGLQDRGDLLRTGLVLELPCDVVVAVLAVDVLVDLAAQSRQAVEQALRVEARVDPGAGSSSAGRPGGASARSCPSTPGRSPASAGRRRCPASR